MMVPCGESGYREFMETRVRDFLTESVMKGQMISFDGARIQYYYAVQAKARASIVLVHGFTEFFGKFHEAFYNFFDQGYNVFFIEQRGHGLSQRFVDNRELIHIDSFDTYTRDLKCFLDEIVVPNSVASAETDASGIASASDDVHLSTRKLPLLLYCHSMGGCVGALFLEDYPVYFKAALLSSPMLKINFGGMKNWQTDLLAKTSKILGWEKRPLPNYTPFDPVHPDFENSSTLSRARFDYSFEQRLLGGDCYTMSGGTYGWCIAAMDAARKIRENAHTVRIPVLICQAGRDDMVDNEGQNVFARHAANCRIRRFPEAKHEIYNSTGNMLRDYEDTVLNFYAEVLENLR